jgi:hypothetical protein
VIVRQAAAHGHRQEILGVILSQRTQRHDRVPAEKRAKLLWVPFNREQDYCPGFPSKSPAQGLERLSPRRVTLEFGGGRTVEAHEGWSISLFQESANVLGGSVRVSGTERSPFGSRHAQGRSQALEQGGKRVPFTGRPIHAVDLKARGEERGKMVQEGGLAHAARSAEQKESFSGAKEVTEKTEGLGSTEKEIALTQRAVDHIGGIQ